MSTHLTLSLASIALFTLTTPAQDAVKIGISPATAGENGTMLVAAGDSVSLRASTEIAPSELHIYAFAPAKSFDTLDLGSMVILHQEFFFAPGGVALRFEIPKGAEGAGVSLVAVAYDEKGEPHPSNLLTVYVSSGKSDP